MLPDYDADAVAKLMGLAFVSAPPPKKFRTAKIKKTSALHLSLHVLRVLEGAAVVTVNGLSSQAPRLAPSPVLIESAVEWGLPREALRHVAESLAGGDRSKVASLESDVVPKTTLERRKGKRLSLKESERTERIARLFVHATRALGTEAEAREFMTAPHPELEGRSPFDVAKTDLGARRVEGILHALEYGLAV
jgi:putative toxin-antitoxin system antitoxin component (TIGR02293 family)